MFDLHMHCSCSRLEDMATEMFEMGNMSRYQIS